jgi:type I restriction enzyme R subunit
LDRGAAKSAFADFTTARALSADQIEYLDLIIDHLTANGSMDPRLLYESPFTDADPMGLAGVFGSDAGAVVAIVRDINRRAAA